MNPLQQSSREQISALADGALHGEAMSRAVDALCADRAMQEAWQDHHAIGDLLRAGARQPCTESSAFLSRFQQRLAAETVPEAMSGIESSSSVLPFPHRKPTTVVPSVAPVEAANEPVFRWKLVSGVASLAAVAAIGWNLVGGGAGPSATGAQLAQQQVQMPVQMASRDGSQVLVGGQPSVAAGSVGLQQPEPARLVAGGGEPQVMLRDARLDQLLEAHRQAGGAAQMPSGFLRNATFDGPSR